MIETFLIIGAISVALILLNVVTLELRSIRKILGEK